MRTNIEIDDGLMAEAMKAGEFRTKREAVEAGLRLIKHQADYRKILKLKGKIQWGWGDEDRLDGQPNMIQTPAAPTRTTLPAAKKRAPARGRR